MSQTDPTQKQTRRQHITREQEADRCLNHTVYSPGAQLITAIFFLLLVMGVPIVQHVVEIRQNLAKRSEWNPSSGVPEPGLAPQIYDVFKLFPTADQIGKAKGFWGYWNLIPSAESIKTFEDSLKENSVLTQSLLSPTQLVLSGALGAGNEKAYIGRDGWLFYRPDVEYLTTPGFLEPRQLLARSHGSTEIQPDPVKAILAFKNQLAARGIRLVVVPAPTKPMIDPEMLVGPSANGVVLENDSFAAFQAALEANGVPVFDASPVLLGAKTLTGTPQYLQSDTHWTPEAMHLTAMQLASFLQERCALPVKKPSALSLRPERVSNLGDIAEMLKLPAGQTLFAKQQVTVEQVMQLNGSPWQADRASDVLLLGDSFSNIYSLGGMGWGTGSGFAEHLSYALGRPIDRIVINAGGSFASRRELDRQLIQGVDRLAGKKVVVYEFSMRDLAQGDWRMIKLPPPPPPVTQPAPVVRKPVRAVTPTKGSVFEGLTVTPEILDLSKHQGLRISIEAPVGSWQVSILDAQGNAVRKLTGGTSLAPYHLTDKWDGTDIDGHAVAPGTYTVEVSGTRLDHSVIAPVTATIQVVGAGQKPAITGPPHTQAAIKPGKPKGGNTAQKPPTQPKPEEGGLMVTGRIAARAVSPKPGSVPYKDCVIALQLTYLKVTGGTIKGPNIVVYVWGMKDNQLVDQAYEVGQTIRFKLTPWSSAEPKYGSYNRQELDSDDALSWEAFWGEIK